MKSKFICGFLNAFLFFISQFAGATIDVKSGTFTDTWVDLELPGSGFHLQVRRTYNSRSTTSGIFGFGWCSDLDSVLERGQNQVDIYECGRGGRVLTFIPEQNKSGMSTSINDKYVSLHFPVEKLEWREGKYIRLERDGGKQVFDGKGRLYAISDQNNHYIKYFYDDRELLVRAQDETGRTLKFSYDVNKRVSKVQGPQATASYRYQGSTLVGVTNAWKNSYRYAYDDLRNLVEIQYPDRTVDRVTYDKRSDWVTEFKSRFGCEEKINYVLSKAVASHQAIVSAKCPGQLVRVTEFQFDGTLKNAKIPMRTEYKIERGQVSSMIVTNLAGERLRTIERGAEHLLSLTERGRISSQVVGPMTYVYQGVDFDRKPSSVLIHDSSRDVFTAQSKIVYQYDGRGNVTSAVEGARVTKFFYGRSGRLERIRYGSQQDPKQSAVGELLLTYEPSGARLIQLTQSGLGTIHLSYLPDGTLGKVDSNLNDEKRIQVVESFRKARRVLEPVLSLQEL